MPPSSLFTKDFLKLILEGKKSLLKKSTVAHVEVPFWDELAVRHLWPMMKSDQEFIAYFPDELPEGRYPPRDYFFAVMNTLYPDYLK